jgi:hypothetical protein
MPNLRTKFPTVLRHRDLDLTLVVIARPGFAFPAALDRPAPVAVNLGAPRRFPLSRYPAAPDRVLLRLG